MAEKVYSVTELNGRIKALIDSDYVLNEVYVEYSFAMSTRLSKSAMYSLASIE